MIIFKTFLKVLNKCKGPVILYTVILLFFAAFSLQSGETGGGFNAAKPNIYIHNEDKDGKLSIGLTKYMEEHCEPVSLSNSKEALDDALFYRDVSMVITIPNGYHEAFMRGEKPKLSIRTTQDYNAALAKLMLERYLSSASFYQQAGYTDDALLAHIESAMQEKGAVEMTSSLDNDSLTKASYFYNFANYSIIAGCIYVICLILSSFKHEMIAKRTLISSCNYRKYNRILLLSNGLFALVLWLFYVLISIILLKDTMLSQHGLVYIINSFLFTCCAVSFALLIANLIINKNAINGIVNVIALGSSFLCGAFVPAEMLPDIVLKIARILPSYWFINTNNQVIQLESFQTESLQPIIINMGILIGFTLLFIIITNFISKRKRKFA